MSNDTNQPSDWKPTLYVVQVVSPTGATLGYVVSVDGPLVSDPAKARKFSVSEYSQAEAIASNMSNAYIACSVVKA